MIFQKSENLTYYQFSTFNNFPITQAIFSRLGGNSIAPWNSLNVGNTVGDDPCTVKLNLDKLLKSLGYQENQLAQVKQVHSSKVRIVDKANQPGKEFISADAMVTNRPGILLLMRFADCVPIFSYDPKENVVGIGHAGWKGTVSKVGQELIRTMEQEFGSKAENVFVGIGPSIGPDHYQVGNDVIQQIRQAFPTQWQEILKENDYGVKLDLWKANTISLRNTGVERIEVAKICTACHLEDWFSHRGEGGITGRFGAAIGLI